MKIHVMSGIQWLMLGLVLLSPSLTLSSLQSLKAQEPVAGEVAGPHAVTVFENRARVLRQRDLDHPAGNHEVTFRRLPAELNPRSLRAIAAGAQADRVLILGVHLEQDFPIPVDEAVEAGLRSKLRDVDQKIRIKTGNRKVADLRKDLLNRYSETLSAVVSNPPGDSQRPLWNLQEVEQIQQWLLAGEVENANELDRLNREITKLQQERNDLLENLKRDQKAAQRSYWTAVVTCQFLEPCKVQLELSYDVPSARWKPVHEARLDESTSKVTWKQGAQVTQTSGEDWSGVELTLSTLRSSLGLSVGRLVPVEVAVEDQVEAFDARRVTGDALAPDSEVSAGREMLEDLQYGGRSGWAEPTIETGFGGVVSFRIQTPADVPSDGSAHTVEIQSWQVDAELSYEATPELGSGVYRRAQLVQPGPGLLLKGEVQCFRSGTYVGLGEVETIAPGQEWVQYFGLEGRLKLHAQELAAVFSPSRSTFSRPRFEKKSLYAVTSFLDVPAKVEVVGRIPVSLVQELEIRMGDETSPEPQVSRQGICRWLLELPAGKRQQIIFQWIAEADRNSENLLDLLR